MITHITSAEEVVSLFLFPHLSNSFLAELVVVIVQRVLPFLAILMSFDLTGYFLSKYLEHNLLILLTLVNEIAKFNSMHIYLL